MVTFARKNAVLICYAHIPSRIGNGWSNDLQGIYPGKSISPGRKKWGGTTALLFKGVIL